MNTEQLVPIHGGHGHAPASELLQARASLKNLLTKEDLVVIEEFEAQQEAARAELIRKQAEASDEEMKDDDSDLVEVGAELQVKTNGEHVPVGTYGPEELKVFESEEDFASEHEWQVAMASAKLKDEAALSSPNEPMIHVMVADVCTGHTPPVLSSAAKRLCRYLRAAAATALDAWRWTVPRVFARPSRPNASAGARRPPA